MRRIASRLIAAVILATALASGVRAQPAPPHSFLFGSWTGGLFPPPSSLPAEACFATPSVIFTRDVVLRASLVSVLYIQRAIETARGTGSGIDIHLLGTGEGFGCEDADTLHVRRISNDEITFPGCKEFPFPLVRCSASG